jgi:hypothetical protein
MTERPATARGALEVILFEDTRFVGSLMFTSPEVTIGSDSGAMVRLEDVDVAPGHAVLHFDGESCRIEDCGSALGTQVNGVAVATQAIEGMDAISIGRYRLRITLHKPALALSGPAGRPALAGCGLPPASACPACPTGRPCPRERANTCDLAAARAFAACGHRPSVRNTENCIATGCASDARSPCAPSRWDGSSCACRATHFICPWRCAECAREGHGDRPCPAAPGGNRAGEQALLGHRRATCAKGTAARPRLARRR